MLLKDVKKLYLSPDTKRLARQFPQYVLPWGTQKLQKLCYEGEFRVFVLVTDDLSHCYLCPTLPHSPLQIVIWYVQMRLQIKS